MNLGDAILNTAKNGLVSLDQPDDTNESLVFVWSSKSAEQFESSAVAHLKKCEHPSDQRMHAWCAACGAVLNFGEWIHPTYNVVTKEKE